MFRQDFKRFFIMTKYDHYHLTGIPLLSARWQQVLIPVP